VDTEIKTVEVVNTGTNSGKVIRFIFSLLGWTLVIGGFFLCITLVFLIFGLPMVFIGGFILIFIQSRQEVSCPHCDRKMYPRRKKDENFTCAKCKRLTILEWK